MDLVYLRVYSFSYNFILININFFLIILGLFSSEFLYFMVALIFIHNKDKLWQVIFCFLVNLPWINKKPHSCIWKTLIYSCSYLVRVFTGDAGSDDMASRAGGVGETLKVDGTVSPGLEPIKHSDVFDPMKRDSHSNLTGKTAESSQHNMTAW